MLAGQGVTQMFYDIEKQERKREYLRHHRLCQMCGSTATSVCLRVPLNRGGSVQASNFIALCQTCREAIIPNEARKKSGGGGRGQKSLGRYSIDR